MVVDDLLRGSRKFNCANVFATQQVELPPELKASVLTNCGRFFAFACSAADAALLGKEFGGPEGTLVAETLPDLKTGQAYVKVRGEPVRLLRVAPPDWKTTPELIARGRDQCLSLGLTRAQIDKEIAERRRRFMPGAGLVSEAPERTHADAMSDVPEGYDGY